MAVKVGFKQVLNSKKGGAEIEKEWQAVKKQKRSEYIEVFLNFLTLCEQEYDSASREKDRTEKQQQDYLHLIKDYFWCLFVITFPSEKPAFGCPHFFAVSYALT